MLAKINGVFRLTRDPELKPLQSGTSLVNLGLVASEKFKDKESVCFIDAVVFGALGEKVVMPYLKKGSQIFISGKLNLEQWEKDGVKRSKHTITIEGLEMIGSKEGGQASAPAPSQPAYTLPAQPAYAPPAAIPTMDIAEDEIPF